MDKTGVASLFIGIILLILGGWAIWVYWSKVVDFVQGVIGILGVLIGIFCILFGYLMMKE